MVLTAGALAVAISAIIALVPKGAAPPSTLAASFVPPIQVYPGTTLDEYAARVRDSTTASLGAADFATYRLAADTTAVVTSDSTAGTDALGSGSSTSTSAATTDTGTSTTDTATSTPGPTSSSTSTSSSSSCTGTATSSASGAGQTSSETCSSASADFGAARSELHVLGSAPDVRNVAEQIPLVVYCPPHTQLTDGRCAADPGAPCSLASCGDLQPESFDTGAACTNGTGSGQCGAGPEISRALRDGVEPGAAARKVVSLFAATRGEVTGHTIHPLGVMVSFEADLVGFSGTPATVRWSLFSANPAVHLDPEWYRTVPVVSITPHANDDRFSSQFWVPEPRRHGDYYVRLEVDSADHLVRTYSDSPIFH